MKKLTTLFIAALCFVSFYSHAQVNRVSGCTLTASIDSILGVSCNGGSNGSANAVPSGGTAPYTYLWSPTGSTNQHATGLTAGCYTVTIVDKNGCTATTTVCITQPSALTVTATSFPVSCNGGSNGQAVCTQGGGTPSYTYSWSDGKTSASINGLTAGTYTITVTDANGCTATAKVNVGQPAPLVVTTTIKSKPSCDTCCNGVMYSTVSGGTPPYTYDWNCTGEHTDTIKDACNGYCNCCITDANGCFNCDTIVVSGLQNISKNDIDYSVYPNPNNGQFTISLSVNTVQAYTVELYNILGQTLSSEVIHPAAGKSTRAMDISSYGKGVYFIAVKSPTGGMSMKKVIVL